jgi:hypothetical protein
MLILGSTPTPGPVIRTYVVAPRGTDWLLVTLKTFLLSPGIAGRAIRSALSPTERPFSRGTLPSPIVGPLYLVFAPIFIPIGLLMLHSLIPIPVLWSRNHPTERSRIASKLTAHLVFLTALKYLRQAILRQPHTKR